jgi:hypothetical protein
VDSVHKLWTTQGWPVHGFVVDDTVAGGQSTPEPSLATAPGRGDLPRGGENGDDDVVHLGNCSLEVGRQQVGSALAVELRLKMAMTRMQ